MSKKRPKNKINGWINLDKPLEMTSTQAIGRIRRILSPEKIGHAGTLDPLATGILPLAMGEATKTIPYMQDYEKVYKFTVTWGEERNTDDAEGVIIQTSPARPERADIEALLPNYTGKISQTPPQFSAIKIQGQRAYDIARRGDAAEIKPRSVFIDALEIIDHTNGTTTFEMTCGKGTYVRAIARDLGRDLGCYGYVSKLRRIAVGPFDETNTISLDKLSEMSYEEALENAILPLESALDDIPALPLTSEDVGFLRNGRVLSFAARHDYARIERLGLDNDIGEALAVFENKPIALVEVVKAKIKPLRVFNL